MTNILIMHMYNRKTVIIVNIYKYLSYKFYG